MRGRRRQDPKVTDTSRSVKHGDIQGGHKILYLASKHERGAMCLSPMPWPRPMAVWSLDRYGCMRVGGSAGQRHLFLPELARVCRVMGPVPGPWSESDE